MAISLVVEVLDHAPRELTQAELVVLVVLAEQAREDTRECWPGMELICHRSRLQEDSVRKVFQRLAARGLEVRVPVGKSKSGQPIYAHHGARTLYLRDHAGIQHLQTVEEPCNLSRSAQADRRAGGAPARGQSLAFRTPRATDR